jgi:Na+/alanine symporter
METINDFFTAFSSFLWGWPMIILLLGTHIFLTIRLRFPQRKIFKAIALSVKKDKDATGDVSQFGALATALAATIGTGNIIGVATAIALGGGEGGLFLGNHIYRIVFIEPIECSAYHHGKEHNQDNSVFLHVGVLLF